MILRILAVAAACAALLACRPATVAEAKRAMSGDQYVRSRAPGDYRIEARMLPEALVFLTYSRLDSAADFNSRMMDSLRSAEPAMNGLMFALTIAPRSDSLPPTDYRNDVVFGQVNGERGYREVLERFQSGLSDKIWLEAGGRKHELRNYHMTNSWGMSKNRTFTLTFDSIVKILPGKSGKITLVMENIVPGQGRDRLDWDLPIHPYDFI